MRLLGLCRQWLGYHGSEQGILKVGVIGYVWPRDLKSQVEDMGRVGMSDSGDTVALD
jgi:hypothetical protein